MTVTIEAVYESGVLKPTEPLPLREHEKVRITLEPTLTWAERTAGMMGWKGTTEQAEYFAMSHDLDFPVPEEDI